MDGVTRVRCTLDAATATELAKRSTSAEVAAVSGAFRAVDARTKDARGRSWPYTETGAHGLNASGFPAFGASVYGTSRPPPSGAAPRSARMPIPWPRYGARNSSNTRGCAA